MFLHPFFRAVVTLLRKSATAPRLRIVPESSAVCASPDLATLRIIPSSSRIEARP